MKRNWEYKKLGDVAKISSGKSIAAEKISDFFCDGMFPCYGGNGLRGYTDSYLYEGKYPIIGRVGALCGNVHLTNGKFYPTEHALIVSLKSDDAPEYITYLLSALRLNRYAKGVAQPVLSAGTLSEIVVPIPPLEEQSRIVAELDLLTGIIDKQNAQLKELDNLAQSIFYDMFGDPIENPKGWVVKMLGDIVANEKYALKAGPFGSALKKEFYKESGYKIYGQEQVIANDVCVGNYYVDESKYQELKSCAVKEDDVLISLVGTFGKVLVIPKWYEPGIINPRLIKITFDKAVVNTVYFRSYFSSSSTQQKLKEMTHGQTMGVLNLGILKQMCIPVPPLALQQSFAEKIQSIEKQKETIRASIADTQKLLDYTMDKYFG